MKIDEKMIDPGPDIFYQEPFMNVLESYMDYLRNATSTITVVVKPEDAAVYRGDFYGYLSSLSISAYMHWTIMRVCNLHSPHEFNSDVVSIRIPDELEINKIKQAFLSDPDAIGL